MLTPEAKRFKAFRKHLKLTQVEIAKELEIMQSEVSKYERGERDVPLSVLKKMHLKFKYNYQWHFHGVGKQTVGELEKPTLVTDVRNLRNDIDAIWQNVEKMEKNLRQLITDFYDFRNKIGTNRGQN